MSRFWWLRHAPVRHDGIVGQADVLCDASDTTAFAALAEVLPRGAVLVESGLRRCRQTAEALRQTGLDLPEALIEPDLAEQDFGRWQGLQWAEIDASAFWRDPARAVPPGGESFTALVSRVGCAVSRLRREHQGREVIVIAHAGTIRAALAVALGMSSSAALSFAVEPLSLTRLAAIGGEWRVEGVNWQVGERSATARRGAL